MRTLVDIGGGLGCNWIQHRLNVEADHIGVWDDSYEHPDDCKGPQAKEPMSRDRCRREWRTGRSQFVLNEVGASLLFASVATRNYLYLTLYVTFVFYICESRSLWCPIRVIL